MKTIKLSIGTVEIVENITWGMREDIKAETMKGLNFKNLSGDKEEMKKNVSFDSSVTINMKYKVIEVCVKKITLSDGKEVTYSKEWMDNLSIQDGDTLFDAIDEVTNPKKK